MALTAHVVEYPRLSPLGIRLARVGTAAKPITAQVCWLPRPCSSNDGQSVRMFPRILAHIPLNGLSGQTARLQTRNVTVFS